MQEKDKAVLRDMQGFIEWAIQNGQEYFWTLSNLGHDINSIMSGQVVDGFCPRTAGYGIHCACRYIEHD